MHIIVLNIFIDKKLFLFNVWYKIKWNGHEIARLIIIYFFYLFYILEYVGSEEKRTLALKMAN